MALNRKRENFPMIPKAVRLLSRYTDLWNVSAIQIPIPAGWEVLTPPLNTPEAGVPACSAVRPRLPNSFTHEIDQLCPTGYMEERVLSNTYFLQSLLLFNYNIQYIINNYDMKK